MKPVKTLSLLALGLAGALTIAACNKSPENAPPPATTTPPPAPATVSTPPPAATPDWTLLKSAFGAGGAVDEEPLCTFEKSGFLASPMAALRSVAGPLTLNPGA
jgi:hypothetical protein